MTERKIRANPDYTASAVNLTNPPEVEGLLRELQNQQTLAQQLRNQAEALIPDELKDEITEAEKKADKLVTLIKQTVDDFGSYQNTELGWYGLKQRRESITYKPELVRQFAPTKVAEYVIIQAIDEKAMNALIKIGQISQVDARKCGVVSESFAYVIR